MSLDNGEIRFSGLFYDALSEEFSPKTDRQQRTHTLGRLIFATMTKGSSIKIPGRSEYFAKYKPSWGDGVAALVASVGEVDSRDHEVQRVVGVDLFGDSGMMRVSNNSNAGHQMMPEELVYLISPNNNSHKTETYTLELGEKLTIARSAIAGAASAFFESQADRAS